MVLLIFTGIGLILCCPLAIGKEGVLSSPHNLSAKGGGGKHKVAFAAERRVCVFCHVPHSAKNPEQLWSRELPSVAYTPYSSSTINADPRPGLPTGASRLCLSCHDGTIALGQYIGSPVSGSNVMPSDPEPTRNPNLSTDLSDDHPISFTYSALLAGQSQLLVPAALPGEIKLDAEGALQCTACHDPHNNEFGNFLVIDNSLPGSPLCTACHANTGWPDAAHNPRQTLTLTGGCMNCHYAHSAPEPTRLLHHPSEEENCTLTCHNGTDANSVNVSSAMTSLYRHPVDITKGVHDLAENLPASNYHVECVDCHNPHQANDSQIPLAFAPDINGPLQGVRKDDFGGIAATEFEICFKCHAGPYASNFRGVSVLPPNRVLQDSDQQNRFDQSNPSFHPVTTFRRGNGASLLVPLQAAMTQIYCSDCHNSDQSSRAGGTGANGPHGSSYEHILLAQYTMPLPSAPPSTYSSAFYDLCFRCHDESYIMTSGTAFTKNNVNLHDDHVRVQATPCYACHDPHGTSWVAGATAINNSHLINFNRDYASDSVVPLPHYETLAPASGSCTVSCHSNASHTRSYSP